MTYQSLYNPRTAKIDSIGLSKVQCPTKHIIDHIGDGFLWVK